MNVKYLTLAIIMFVISLFIYFDITKVVVIEHETHESNEDSLTFNNQVHNQILLDEIKTEIVPTVVIKPSAIEVKVDSPEELKEDRIKISKRDMFVLVGDERQLKWQDEYDKSEYESSYDITWQNDILAKGYELVSDKKYLNNIEISEFSCENFLCNMKLKELPENQKSMQKLTSEFMLDLKHDPSILKSGKKRDVYLSSLKRDENGKFITQLVVR